MNFLKINGKGPTITVGYLTRGTAGGIDDGKGGAAILGQTQTDVNTPNGVDKGTITLDRGLVDAARDAIESEATGACCSLNGATGFLFPEVESESKNIFAFTSRVVEHETTHWGGHFNLGIPANQSDDVYFFGLPVERGQLFERAGFGNLGDVFSPASNPSWAIAREYIRAEFRYTHDLRDPNVTDAGYRIIQAQLQRLALKYQLKPAPHQ